MVLQASAHCGDAEHPSSDSIRSRISRQIQVSMSNSNDALMATAGTSRRALAGLIEVAPTAPKSQCVLSDEFAVGSRL